jgi:hypothetical protein
MLRPARARALRLAAAFLLALPLLGCDVLQQVTVALVDFETSQVEGISLWRLDPGTAQWERRYEIQFGTTYVKDGIEYIDYTLLNIDGSEFMQAPAQVIRDPAQPGSVQVSMWFFVYDPPSQYKVAAFNAYGESALSQATHVMDGA